MEIKANDWVVVIKEDGSRALVRATKNAELKVSKSRALGDELIGHPFGSTFEFADVEDSTQVILPGGHQELDQVNATRVKNNKPPLKYSRLVRVQASEDPFAILKRESTSQSPIDHEQDEHDYDTSRDNRNYISNPDNQKASTTELREAGASGVEIVRALAENSTTFTQKTKFSQEKYLKRITAKHVPRVTCVQATSRSVAEVLFSKHPPLLHSDPIRSLRWVDALPQLLAHGNIHAGARCLVLDGVGGLLSLSILERLREEHGGRCIFVGTSPREIKNGGGRPFIDFINLKREALLTRFIVFPSNRMQADGSIAAEEPEEPKHSRQNRRLEEQEPLVTGDQVIEQSSEQDHHKRQKACPDEETLRTEQQEREVRQAGLEQAAQLLDMKNGGPGADSLLIAARHDPSQALDVLLPHLGIGCPFVVHHPCLEPLMIARAKLAESRAVLDLTVTESFCREYQVLKDRTHPHMSGSAQGGWILKGIKVQVPASE